jgi:hypothetical protein
MMKIYKEPFSDYKQKKAGNLVDRGVEVTHVKKKRTALKDSPSRDFGLARTPISKGGGYVVLFFGQNA